ncbi:BTB/POZ domain-containing protein [Ditylenchus destructor]|uniref:BTB/POZ domain-containing protein n=1 Tax=Ditylenchus destructor TaxID=166010 RepID=A0AAD4R290_9BILA|nr:BTB/POZ domain-containing protein [Ditylenchus destructor]
MSTTKDVSEAPIISKQCTKLTPVSTKLEWRIEHFDRAMRFYEGDQAISSKTFTLPIPIAVTWRLDVYPHGMDTLPTADNNPHFYLRLIGFQESDGSISANSTKSINTDYKIYLLSSTNEEIMVKQGLSGFKTESTVSSHLYAEEAQKFIHPDGSLLVICEIECLAPKKTFSLEPTSSIQLTDHIGKMWKSQLFTDCTLKVGDKSFPAHKCILGQWSEVFRNMFSLPTEEAESGIVEIEDFTPDAVRVDSTII